MIFPGVAIPEYWLKELGWYIVTNKREKYKI
jgi:hypothetical protein